MSTQTKKGADEHARWLSVTKEEATRRGATTVAKFGTEVLYLPFDDFGHSLAIDAHSPEGEWYVSVTHRMGVLACSCYRVKVMPAPLDRMLAQVKRDVSRRCARVKASR